MLASISSAINGLIWDNSKPEDTYLSWLEWQKKQPVTLFEKCELFDYYLSKRPNFLSSDLPYSSCLTSYNKKHYVYCFGDFAILIATSNSGGRNVVDFISVLLDIYDTCKGYFRAFKGDAAGISLLREVVAKRNISVLNSHNFNQYNYPYNKIHAHTVAQFSLSTLLMKVLSDYLIMITNNQTCSSIEVGLCKKAFDANEFGKVLEAKTTNSIGINIQQAKVRGTPKINSWPQIENDFEQRCSVCQRVSESLWSQFSLCLDCYLKRRCSKCGKEAIIIGVDSLPKCNIHQE